MAIFFRIIPLYSDIVSIIPIMHMIKNKQEYIHVYGHMKQWVINDDIDLCHQQWHNGYTTLFDNV